MAVVTLVQSGTNNGTATPATPGSLTTTAGNLLILAIATIGTSPVMGLPTGFSTTSNNSGAVLSVGLWKLINNPGGATNPSSTLTGTVTGWVAVMLELTAVGTIVSQIGTNPSNNSTAQLPNVIPTNLGQAPVGNLFVYVVARTGTNTVSAPTSGLNNWAPPGYAPGASQWSSSVQPLSGVQGLSMDLYWGVVPGDYPQPYPQAAGLLSAAVTSTQIAGWYSTNQTTPTTGKDAVISGGRGTVVAPFNQGMVGG